jgi:hypothetical protein
MPKEAQEKPVESPKTSRQQAASQTGLEQDGIPAPVTTGKSFVLPRIIKPKQLQALQRATGNRSVQRLLNRNVIQRQGGNTVPIPALPDFESRRALALNAIKKAYGGLIKQEAKIVEVKGLSAMQTQYDQAMIRQGKVFVENDEETPWAPGDAARHPNISRDLAGFNDPSTGQIYIDTEKKADEQTATIAHEMLHANSSGEILSVLGRGVDEGITETLTKKAFEKAGYSAPGGYYAGEMAFVSALSSMFGENTIMYSYFNGVASLRSMMDTTLNDEGIFDKFAAQVRAKNYSWTDAFFRRYQKAREGSELEKKMNAIASRLGGWWVSDDDIAHIENIYRGASEDEQMHLRHAIESRLTSLSSHGQRARLRILIAS